MLWLVSAVAFLLVAMVSRRAFAKDHTVLHTPEEVANARQNVRRYDWAKAELAQLDEACRPWL